MIIAQLDVWGNCWPKKGILILCFVFKITVDRVKELEGMSSPWRKSKVDWMLESILSPIGPSLFGVNYLLTVF